MMEWGEVMRTRIILVLAAASLLGQLCPQSDWSEIAQQTKDSVVKIIVQTAEGEPTGTGFVVSADGKIATNYHVIEGASKIFVRLPNGKTVGIERVVAFDKRVDLAILQVQGVSLRPLPLGDSSAVKVGQEVCVMGSPLGLEQSFSTGVVSAKRVLDGFEWVQITAPISPGSSGSPVMTRQGTVIGVATFTTKIGQNLNFASSVKYLKRLLQGEQIKPEPSGSPSSDEPSVQQSSPSRLLVTNAEELVQAIAEIREGGEITLQPGEYRLRTSLVIQKSLTIVGAGYDKTVLVYEGDYRFFIDHRGVGSLAIRDVGLRYSGTAKASVVVGSSGDIRLTRCLVSGGTGRDDKYVGAGIAIYDNARAVISECIVADNEIGVFISDKADARIEFCKVLANMESGIQIHGNCEVRHSELLRNQKFGIKAADKAHLTARNNTCEESDFGIALVGSAKGEIDSNICQDNHKQGISASEQSRLVARNNTCEGNKQCGISLFGSAQGEVEGNTCRNNGLHGIGAHEQSRLVARNNTCEGNKQDGISLFGSAQGEVSGNACRNNGYDGIGAQEQSRLTARNNTCEGNKQDGISLFGSAQGEVEGNACRNNGYDGIAAQEQSRLTARNNTCKGNTYSGIALFGSAQGEVSGNACRNNGLHGIGAHEQSRLAARNNTCEGNEMSGIALFGSVQGEIEGNQCANNKLNGIYIHERSVKATLRNNTVYGNRGGDIYDPRR
jgi:parallel beta-helix repeat protein